MKKLRKLTAVLIALVLTLSISVSALADMSAFELDGSYEAGRFSDVDETKWYGYYKQGVIATAYELGLMSGNSSTTFNPDGKLRLSEAVTIAARLRSIYEGDGKIFEKTSPWYKTYVDYAEDMGIIPDGWMDGSETRPATRAEMAFIFSYALPDEEYEKVNDVQSLPDVYYDSEYADEIFKLYNAGILQGNGQYGTFYPDNSVKRSEAAAIICRIAIPDMRLEFELKPKPEGQWLSDYSNDEVLSYFLNIAYQREYGNDRDYNFRWTEPLR
ncbi:MAG: S-layer homology domain-containing protein, partial [Oscillospiraceae bacterium]|nr:S-layer homology domain-containing protein [Oscillospiraceae bacterium]